MLINDDWEFNVLQIYNYKKEGKLDGYFKFIENNYDKLDGDIVEIGVFKGASLIAAALLLKELGSDKVVWGFDSFSGFPSYHELDSLSQFERLYKEGHITKEHHACYLRNLEYRGFMNKHKVSPSTISTSGDFSGTSKSMLEDKIDFFNLDNIHIVDGDFQTTMQSNTMKEVRFMVGLMDCDLYESHAVALPFVWDRMVKNGYMFLDEYFSLKFPGARIAINNFFSDKQDGPQMYPRKTTDFERWYVTKKNS